MRGVGVIGPLPPPSHGHMIFTRRLLESSELARRFRLVHVDISDHRELGTLGRLELVNFLLALRHFGRLIGVLARERPALVHVPLAQNLVGLGRDLVFVAICMLARVRVVAHVHGGGLGAFLDSAPRWFSGPARMLLRRCSALVVMSRWQAERVRPAIPGARIVVIPHGTEENPAPPAQPREERFRALYVSSHLHESKGLGPLVAAAARAQAEGVTTEWEIVGAWLDEETRIATERRLEGMPGINFRGAVDRADLAAVYADAEAFVFPTGPSEGFAFVRIEAMAAGLPVITTEAGGGREIVRDGVEGFIVGYDDADAIVASLRRLRDDPELHAKLARQAQERQRTEFAERTFCATLGDLWEAVAAGRPVTEL